MIEWEPTQDELDGKRIKPKDYKQEYTAEQVREMARCKKDAIYFIENYVKIKHPKHGAISFNLYDFQKRLIQTYIENTRCISMLSRQCGKALALDTPIPTPTGWTTMGDIKVGDEVLGDDGQRVSVTFVTDPMYGHACYDVIFKNGEVITADADHDWNVIVDQKYYTWTTSKILDHMAKTGEQVFINSTKSLSLPPSDMKDDPFEYGELAHKIGFIDDYVLRGSHEQRLHMLFGILGDEIVDSREDFTLTIPCHTRYYSGKVSELLSSLGYIPRIVEENDQIYVKFFYSGSEMATHEIVNIVPRSSVPVKCISVDNESHLYLCGKSMIPTHNTATAAAYLLWVAIFRDDQNIFIASKDQGGADEIMERLFFAYEFLPFWIKPGCVKNDVKTKIFDNGSKIMTSATTKTSGRGKSPSLVYLDEFAFVPPSIANEFWVSIFAALSTGGDCIITSTPNTDIDKFAQLWFSAEPSDHSDVWEDKLAKRYGSGMVQQEKYETIYETEEIEEITKLKDQLTLLSDDVEEDDELAFVSFHAHWTSVPDKIDKNGNIIAYRGEKFKHTQLKSGLSNTDWDREYECCFISGEATLISGSKLAALRATVCDPRFVDRWGVRWYEPIKPNTAYAVVMDPSGDGVGDDAAIQVWEIPTLKQVAEWNDAESDQDEQTRMLWRVLTRIDRLQNNNPIHRGGNDIYYSVERNSIGIGIIRVIEHVGEDKFPGWFVDSTSMSSYRGEARDGVSLSRYRGLLTTTGSKRRYAQEFKQLVERNLFTVRSRYLSDQLKNFVRTGSSWAAKEGSKDDLIMSCILMCHLIEEIRDQEPDLDDALQPDVDDYEESNEEHPDNSALPPVI